MGGRWLLVSTSVCRLRASSSTDLRCISCFGSHVASWVSTEVMRRSGKVADYIASRGMRSFTAIRTLAIRRVRRPYGDHTLTYAGHTPTYGGITALVRYEMLVIR